MPVPMLEQSRRNRPALGRPDVTGMRLGAWTLPSPAEHFCCGCCTPLARAVTYMSYLMLFYTVHNVTIFFIQHLSSDTSGPQQLQWSTGLQWTLLMLQIFDIFGYTVGVFAVRNMDLTKAKIFYISLFLGVHLKTIYWITKLCTIKQYCAELQSSTCQSSNFTDGMWNLVITVVLYNYLAYIAWSFRVRLENGTAYGVAQREQSGEYIFGVSSELYRASSLIHHRPHVPMFVVYARPFEDYLHSKNEPALGVPVAEHRLVVPQRHEAVLGRAAWPAPVSSMESDSGSGMNSAAMEEGSNVDDDSSSLEDMYTLEILGLTDRQLEERLN